MMAVLTAWGASTTHSNHGTTCTVVVAVGCWVALQVWSHFLHSCRENGRTWGARLRNWTRRTRATCRCQSSAPFLNLPTSFWTKTKSTTWWVTSTKTWPGRLATPSSWTKRLSRSRVWVKAKCHNTRCPRQSFSQCSVPTYCRHQAVRDQKKKCLCSTCYYNMQNLARY